MIAIVDLLHASVPRPVLRLFLLPHWAGHWPCVAAGTRQGGASLCRTVSLYTTSLKLTQTALMNWLATVKVSAYVLFQWGNVYWIAAAQWMAVIDAGAIPCTLAPHTLPSAPVVSHRRTACVTLSVHCPTKFRYSMCVVNPQYVDVFLMSVFCHNANVFGYYMLHKSQTSIVIK